MQIQPFIRQCQERSNQLLEKCLPPAEGDASRLYQAMRYSVLNGGKRLRPALVYATVVALRSPIEQGDAAACAVELTHSYSLIHDDLPAMDDDDLRRGQPTCHVAYDEATAILAGDALQVLAFEVIADDSSHSISDVNKLRMLKALAQSTGYNGMVAGQAIDLYSVGKPLSLEQLKHMHNCKTGALIKACVTLGALATNQATQEQLQAFETFAICIGLAFQIKDDILDVEGDTQTLGKSQGADLALNKPTYTSILGLEQAKREANEQHQNAIRALSIFGPEADALRELATYIIERNR
ncbi:MAG: (2E,6E)-farnesyl diphosphate synthase [Pseudomonadales bacterium]|nr:(2E,6E)-farnesyl diphosphate synthase [Pseudomonadales bacterium]MCP5213737.1 (2E,6E)-farnesyl diphosphate synthase [Pseudomonadales bacterium]